MRFFYKGKRLTGLILLCLGIGVLMAILLPVWGWLAIGGIGLICIGWYCFRN